MRAFWLCLGVALALGACTTAESKLKDISWGEEINAPYDIVLERALYVLRREFPKGLDPDRTDEDKADYTTVWHYYRSTMYWSGTRARARLKIEDLGDDRCRVGISVVRQHNADMDNPMDISEARWTRTHRDTDTEARIESAIARRYTRVEPSELWKEKNRETPSKTLRSDIVERNKDVDLEGTTEPGSIAEQPGITNREDFWDPYEKKEDEKKK